MKMHPLFVGVVLTASIVSCSREHKSDKAGEKMQEFVISIAEYARGIKGDFMIVPQNGAELCFSYLDPTEGLNSNYLSAISAVGIEELFYNGSYQQDEERLGMLRQIVGQRPVLVSEFVEDPANVQDALQKNAAEGFLCFPRSATNYDYLQIPDFVPNENAGNIFTMGDVRNYLYLISTGGYADKQSYLSAIAATNFDLVLIDAFYDDALLTSAEVQSLKTKANGGKRLVLAYMNIGAAESYRYYWQDDWKLNHPGWLEKPYDGYEDEIWVKFWKKDWQEIIFGNDDSYTKKIIDAGFDGAYLDNVEAYYFLYFE